MLARFSHRETSATVSNKTAKISSHNAMPGGALFGIELRIHCQQGRSACGNALLTFFLIYSAISFPGVNPVALTVSGDHVPFLRYTCPLLLVL